MHTFSLGSQYEHNKKIIISRVNRRHALNGMIKSKYHRT
jgi:hypothetical protein